MDNLQERILTQLQAERQVVTLITINGFQMKGRITGFDQFTVVLEIRDEQQIVYKHAISTITPAKLVSMEDQTCGCR